MENKIIVEYLDTVPEGRRPCGFWENIITDFLASGKPVAQIKTLNARETYQYVYGIRMCAERKSLPVKAYRRNRAVIMERVEK